MEIFIHILLTVAGLFFTLGVITKHISYDTKNMNIDRLIIGLLWAHVFIDNLEKVINHFKM